MGFLKLFDAVAEKIILDAMENGEFDNIEGKGKPLRFEDESMIPQDLRMGFKILKNSGHIPPELEQEREIRNVKDLLANCHDERERYRQMQKLNYMVMKTNMMRKRPVYLEKSQYYDRMAERIKVRPEGSNAAQANPVPHPEPRTSSNTICPPKPMHNPGSTAAERRSRFFLLAWFKTKWAQVYS